MHRLDLASRRPRSQRGAAVVELALVTVVFLPLLLGLIDYGLWFNDTLNVRSGVREGVRQAVVQAEVSGPCSSETATDLDKMRCNVKQEIASVSGPASVMVKTTSDGWVQGAPLLVCAIVDAGSVTGMVPLPDDGHIYASTRMSIEMDDPVPSGVAASGESSTSDAPPPGADWDWCR